MTLFYVVNSLFKIDTLIWCQTYWYYYNTKNGVMGTLDLVLLLHFIQHPLILINKFIANYGFYKDNLNM